ncbi:MAG: hypothetical protein ACHQ4H_13970 [Ktedonobacterales bacterium]
MHVELDCYDLAGPAAIPGGWAPEASVVHALTPPRQRAIDPDATHRLPRLTVANLRVPVALVRQRADGEVAARRATGAPNSLRVWRESHQRMLLALAREAAGAPAWAYCEALTWEQDGAEYHLTATFSERPST